MSAAIFEGGHVAVPAAPVSGAQAPAGQRLPGTAQAVARPRDGSVGSQDSSTPSDGRLPKNRPLV